MNGAALKKLIAGLLDLRADWCPALTGVPFHIHAKSANLNRVPSIDRIDSDGHYDDAKLQAVWRFVKFCKGDTPDEESRRPLALVLGTELDALRELHSSNHNLTSL